MNGQRVNIQYSVKIEDLPETVQKLLLEAEERITKCTNDYFVENVPESVLKFQNYHYCTEKIDELRTALADVDYLLSDCSAMLAGMAQMKASPPEPLRNRVDEIHAATEQTASIIESSPLQEEGAS